MINLLIDNRTDKENLEDIFFQDILVALEACYKVEGLEGDYEISFSFVGPEEIKELNKNYRGKDAVTDVLSFPLSLPEEDPDYYLGDIVVCLDRANEQALEFNHSLKREIIYLTIHSFFHLLGYDHMNDSEKKIMREKEKSAVIEVGVFKWKIKTSYNH